MDDRVLLTLTILNERWDESWTVRRLAEEIGVHERYLRHLFFEETGTTIREWLHRRRIKEAATLLARTHLHVCDIGLRVGFKDASHFTRKFGSFFRVTPREYRRRVKKGLFVIPRPD